MKNKWFEYGSNFGDWYLFAKGEGLAMHRHEKEDEKHCVILLRGSIRVTSRGSNLDLRQPAPAIIQLLPEWHEITALEDGTEIVNLYQHGKPAAYANAQPQGEMEPNPLENPI